ncbi:PIG-L family deacetylase [Patescibacteria group bacterium]|nr:PIG-L family deacetylase [Patescibacteria group bacterium]
MYSYEDIFTKKKRVLFVVAHPDDVDVFFGGTLARLKNDGKEAFVLIITNGGMGSGDRKISVSELAKNRKQEQTNALKNLGLSNDHFTSLNYLDGEVEDSMKLIGEISEVIRKFRPEIVCTHEPHGYYFTRKSLDKKLKGSFINHRDHRNTGLATLDAVYPFSRDRSFFKNQLKNGLEPHSVFEIFLTENLDVNTRIDITDVIESKKKALLCHKSQFSEKIVEEIIGRRKVGKKYFERGNYIKLAW